MKNLMKKCAKATAAVAFTLLPVIAFAASSDSSIGGRAEDWQTQANALTILLVFGAALLGLGLLIAGGLQLKKYSDEQGRLPLSKPLIYLAAGALIFGVSATSETMTATLFGKEVDNESFDFSSAK